MSLVKVLLVAFVICGVAEGVDNGSEQIHLSSTGQLVVYIERVLAFSFVNMGYSLSCSLSCNCINYHVRSLLTSKRQQLRSYYTKFR